MPTACSHDGCSATVGDHQWDRRRASMAGWFFGKVGEDPEATENWCPEHLPEWVGPWRARRAARAAVFTDRRETG